MPKEKNLDFTDKILKFEKNTNLVGTFFAAKVLLNGETRQLYFFIQEIEGDWVYISYCRTFGFFKKYIIGSGMTIKLKQNKLEYEIKTDLIEGDNKQWVIKGFRIKQNSLINLEGKFLLIGDHKIKFIKSFDGTINNVNTKATLTDKEDEINFKSFFTLQQIDKNDKGEDVSNRFTLKNPALSPTNADPIKVNGGFPNIVGAADIKNTSIIKI